MSTKVTNMGELYIDCHSTYKKNHEEKIIIYVSYSWELKPNICYIIIFFMLFSIIHLFRMVSVAINSTT